MNYRETLENAKKHKIDALKLSIAHELDYFIESEELEFNEEQFETACDLIETSYIKCDVVITVWSLTIALIDMVKEIDIDVLEEISENELIHKASYYL